MDRDSCCRLVLGHPDSRPAPGQPYQMGEKRVILLPRNLHLLNKMVHDKLSAVLRQEEFSVSIDEPGADKRQFHNRFTGGWHEGVYRIHIRLWFRDAVLENRKRASRKGLTLHSARELAELYACLEECLYGALELPPSRRGWMERLVDAICIESPKLPFGGIARVVQRFLSGKRYYDGTEMGTDGGQQKDQFFLRYANTVRDILAIRNLADNIPKAIEAHRRQAKASRIARREFKKQDDDDDDDVIDGSDDDDDEEEEVKASQSFG